MVIENLVLLGQWLNQDELHQLNNKVCDKLAHYVAVDDDFLTKGATKTALSKKDMLDFMGNLFVLGMMYLGGQRRQFTASMTVSVRKQIFVEALLLILLN